MIVEFANLNVFYPVNVRNVFYPVKGHDTC